MSDPVQDQWTSTGSSLYVVCGAAQTFVASDTYTMTELRLRLARGSTYVATDVIIDLYTVDGSHDPNVLIGNIGAINTSALSTSFATVFFTGISFALTATVEYAIVMRPTGDYVCISGDITENNAVRIEGAFGYSNGYGRNKLCAFVGTWACLNWASTGRDWYFRVYGVPVSSYKVINPGPEDDETDVNRVTNLTWDEGEESADNYNVWFGTPGNMVLVGTEITNEFFNIHDYNGGLNLDTEYEWRIDSYVNSELVATGDVWSYTTRAQRTVVLSSPTNGITDKLLPPFLIEWTIDGIGAQYGNEEDQDFLFIYMRKDDANFTEDNLIGNFVQAVANDDLRIVALTAPVYGSTYYWQVQAGNTAADLADSEVWSFTMLDFSPPLFSTQYRLVYGEPGGPGDPDGDPGPQGGGSQPGTGNVGEIPSGGSPPAGGEDSPDVRNYEVIPSGENNLLTARRLIVAAKNKIFYEDV